MKKERNNISDNLISTVIFEMEHFLSKGIPQSPQMLIEGYISKTVEERGSRLINNYSFTDKITKNSIKCLIIPEPSIDSSFQYPITIAKYLFDHIVTLASFSSKELQSNLFLIIETYSMPSSDTESGRFVMKPPKNINHEDIIQQKSNEMLDLQIKKLLNEYHYKLSSNAQQVNFIARVFPSQQNESVIKIACSLFNVQQGKGLLLQSRRGIDYPLDYFSAKVEDEASLESLKSLDWKALFERSATLSNKTNEGSKLFQPSLIDIKELKGNLFEKEKNVFLTNKTKRDKTTKEEKDQYPNKINNLIDNYGDLQANIGLSFINKYVLYKKYMAIVEKEKIKAE